ncbi:MAG: electron transfer flavoprotein subunit alpha/FixB family protein [Magnetospirillum gryphiswaldense]|nr:electron transfer flavoprotein subunit alpha/FixB family protein [Magnetospirillum gryphiswaldense]
MTILVLAEHEAGSLKAATLNTVSAAQKIGADIHVLVAADSVGPIAAEAAKIAGVAKVLCAEAACYAHHLAEPLAALVVSLAGGYSHILAPATTSGKNVAPRVAALLDVAQISEIINVVSADTFVRPIYAGNALATVQSQDAVKVITVRATGFEAAALTGSAAIEAVAVAADPALSSFVGQELSKSERPELTSARIIISGGRGMQSGDNFKLLEAVADKLGAAVGASRAAVDQHLAGMKDSKVIVAINKDEEAPIFQVADYGLVADLFKAVPELTDAL